jgi:sugar/nucleoside kinase (ribokinase family)
MLVIKKSTDFSMTVTDFSFLQSMISHMAAAVVSQHCGDLTVVGGAAATFSVGGSRLKVSAWSGGNLMQFDADAYVLARTAEEITHTYTDEVPPPVNIFFISNSALALQAVQNPRYIEAHASALRFHHVLTTFTLRHIHISFYLVWSPADSDLEGFQMASTWATAVCLHDPPNGLD